MLTLVVALLANQLNYCPNGNVSNPNTCVSHGDPVNLDYGDFTLSRTDTTISSTQGPLTFVRSFSSNVDTWKRTITNGDGLRNVPKPFGESLSGQTAHWWHDWFSFVETSSANPEAYWRQPGGRGTSWGTSSCYSGDWSTIDKGEDETVKLGCPRNWGIIAIDPNGRRLHYRDTFDPPGASSRRWFLSRTDDSRGLPLVSVTYAQPQDADGNVLKDCPQPDPTNWVPYIYLIQNVQTRATLRLTYTEVKVNGETRCVIHELRHGFGSLVADPPLKPVKRYTVASTGGHSGVPSWSLDARLVSVEQQQQLQEEVPSFTPEESYFYVGSNTCAFAGTANPVWCEGGQPYVCDGEWQHEPGQGCLAFRVRGPYNFETHRVFMNAASGIVTGVASKTQGIDYLFNGGDVSVKSAAIQSHVNETFELVGNDGTHSARLEGFRADPPTGPPHPPGFFELGPSATLDWSIVAGARARITTAVGDRSTVQTIGPGLVGGWPTSLHLGADATTQGSWANPEIPGNCVGLECSWQSYSTAFTGSVIPEVTTERSVVAAAGTLVETHRTYDPGSGLLTSVIRRGYSLNASGIPVLLHIGIFYRLTRTSGGNCLAGSETHKIVEVEGPCSVTGLGATSCSAPGQLVQYTYHPEVDGNPNSGRLASQRAYPGGCSGVTPLVTTYSNYSTHGGAGIVIDPNGTQSNYTFDNLGRVTSRMVDNSATWSFGYTAHGKLAWTKNPEGDYLVNCYTGVPFAIPPASCTNIGDLNPQPVWVARSASSDGSGWTTARYDSWVTGRLVNSSYYRAGGILEESTSTNFDGRKRASGITRGSGPGQWAGSARKLDRSGLVSLIGPSGNLPPQFCTTSSGAASPECHGLTWDRASRLERLHQTPEVGQEVNAFFEYDKAGNACELALTATGSMPSNAECQLDDPDTAGYQFDDFGNLIRISLPNSVGPGGTKGVTVLAYDPAGNLIYRKTPTQAATNGMIYYLRDRMGRVTSINEMKFVSGSWTVVSLYTFENDSATVPPNCTVPQNAKGRVAAVSTPLGKTLFSYDGFGHQTVEELLKTGNPSCAAPSSSFKTQVYYSTNGNPYYYIFGDGYRSLYYIYDYGANADRVTAVYVASGGYSWTQIVQNVDWTARGELKSYQAWLPDTFQWIPVAYDRGTDGRLASLSNRCTDRCLSSA